ncbi:MAG: ABC transporter substrate-binding protein, partial [SAR202 cluster bacterium]|nr:ABC transporter substrate-binding protein [SAR202 cluster bacterium]
MISNIKSFKKSILTSLGILLFFIPKSFCIELNMYYPVAVGGPLTKIVDGMVNEFERKNPD